MSYAYSSDVVSPAAGRIQAYHRLSKHRMQSITDRQEPTPFEDALSSAVVTTTIQLQFDRAATIRRLTSPPGRCATA